VGGIPYIGIRVARVGVGESVAKEILIVDNDEIILAGVGDALGEAGFIGR